MSNPFDSKTQKEQHDFFKQITEAINQWMLKEYPMFDTELEGKIKRLKSIQNELETSFSNHKQAILQDKELTLEFYHIEIRKFMAESYPDMSGKLSKIAGDLEKSIKKREKIEKDIDDKLKKIMDSASLCEDVYRVRDEMRELKKSMESFTKNIKKVFS